MGKILLIIIIGIFVLGVTGGIAFGLDKDSFTIKVTKIDPNKLCEKVKNKTDGKFKLKKCKNNMEEIDVDDSIISIKKNEDGIIQVDGR